jgi:hypothetical protein
LYPVATNQTQFYLSAPGAAAGDVTFFQVFNFMPPPVAIAESFLATASIVGANTLTTLVTQTGVIIPAGINGILTAANVYAEGVTGGAANTIVNWSLTDNVGAGVAVARGVFMLRAGINYDNLPLMQMSNINAPFHNGLALVSQVASSAAVAGILQASLYTH